MKRTLWIIVLAAFIVAIGILGSRWLVEAPNRSIELVYDLEGLLKLSEKQGFSLNDLLGDLAQLGIKTVAVQPENLGETLLQGKPLTERVKGELPGQVQDLSSFLLLPIAFQEKEFKVVQAGGLQITPKINTVPWEVEPIWLEYGPEMVLLSGQGELRKEQLNDFDGKLALVEFSTPQVNQLATDNMVRLHGISAPEMETLSKARILNRYVRAVRERNIRVLYLRPFVEGIDSWQRSKNLVLELSELLSSKGFIIGVSKPFRPWRINLLWTSLVAAGVWAATVLYGQILFPKMEKVIIGCGFLGWLTTLLVLYLRQDLGKQGVALIGALVFPALAIKLAPGSTSRRKFWGVAGISILGASMVAASLSGTDYLLKIQEFRGVKVAHLIPIALVAFTLVRPLSTWLQRDVPMRYLVYAGCLGLVGVLYILRTGNFGIPVPTWEVEAREFLENILGTRPRTKEFLIGHPALYLALRQEGQAKSWLLPIAVVGQISLINTFTHIHTPLYVSLLRTAYGLIFGYIIGWVLLQGLKYLKRWLDNGLGSRLLWIRKSR